MLKNKILILIAILGACIILIWFRQKISIIVEAQTQTPTLTFEVITRQNSYLLREPIPLELKLSNQTNVPIKSGSRFRVQDTNFLVYDETGKNTRWELAKYSLDGSPSGVIEILPGKKMESENLLDGKLAEMIFPHAGIYEVQVEYVYNIYTPQQEQIKFIANPVRIIIREPQGIDKQAYDFLTGTYEPARQRSDATPLKQLAQDFVDKFQNSVYAKYMIVELASIYRGAEDAKALRELCKIYNVDFYHTKQVKKALLEINAKLYPVVLNPNLPEDAPTPLYPHPCTGKPINPHNF